MSKSTEQFLEVIVKASQSGEGGIKQISQPVFDKLIDIIVNEASEVKTFSITFTPAQMKTIGFGQTILIPPPAGKKYVPLSAEAILDFPDAFGQAYDFADMAITTEGAPAVWFTFTGILDQTEDVRMSGTPVYGKNIETSTNGALQLTGLNSDNGNSPVTISITYKLIDDPAAEIEL